MPYFPVKSVAYKVLYQGECSFALHDQKGREVGFWWQIKQTDATPYAEGEQPEKYGHTWAEGDPLSYIEVYGSPTRNGNRYGPCSNHCRVADYPAALKEVERRIAVARKRELKRFAAK
jgi:hypothetical protein